MSSTHLPPDSSTSTDGGVLPIQPFLKAPVPVVGIFGLSPALNRAVAEDVALALSPRRSCVLHDALLFQRDTDCPDCGGLPGLERAVESEIKTACPDFFIVACPPEFEPRWLAGPFPDTAATAREVTAHKGGEGRPQRLPAFDLAVSVIDASRLGEDLWKASTLSERDPATSVPEGHREDDVLDVLFTQIESADLLVLAEADRVKQETLVEMRALLGILNPSAIIVEWTKTSGALALVPHLGKGIFSESQTLNAARWSQVLEANPHAGRGSRGTRPGEWIPGFESEETGIVAAVYRRYRPFHPGRLLSVVESRPTGILRSVGVGWVATESGMAFHWSQAAGGTLYFYPEGPWMAGPEGGGWEWDRPEFDGIEKAWDAKYGDRHITLTLIGSRADVTTWMKDLDACLLTDDEMASDWSKLEDPIRAAMEAEIAEARKGLRRFEVIRGDAEESEPVAGASAQPRKFANLRLVSPQETGPTASI